MDTLLKPKNDQLRLHIGIIAGFKPSKRLNNELKE